MEEIIAKLMKHHDRGTLTRRELMQGLMLLVAASTTTSAAGFEASTLNHVSVRVSNLQRSADWYRKMFSLSDFEPPQKDLIQFALGKSHLALRVGDPAGRIDHFALGIPNSTEAAVIQDLKQRGSDATGLQVKDPDGLSVHLILEGKA